MKFAESIVLNKLHDYRILESKDRFILPIGKDIKLFTKVTKEIDDSHIFLNIYDFKFYMVKFFI